MKLLVSRAPVLIAVSFAVAACHLRLSEPTVVVAGVDQNGIFYRRDGVRTGLPVRAGTNGEVNAVSLSGGAVVTSGTCVGSPNTPCYWIGTRRIDLPLSQDLAPPAITATANGLFVQGSTVHVGGFYSIDGQYRFPCRWENSIFVQLNIPTTGPAPGRESSEALAILAIGNNVYAVGQYQRQSDNALIACYWLNGACYPLPDQSGNLTGVTAKPTAICADGDVIYIGGQDFGSNTACYWTIVNGTASSMINLASIAGISQVNSMAAEGGILRVAGVDGTDPCYWTVRNAVPAVPNDAGICTILPIPNAGTFTGVAFSICCDGGNIYSAGCYDNGPDDIPCYWINSVRTDLPGTGQARAIAVR